MEENNNYLYGLKLCKTNCRALYIIHYGEIEKDFQVHHKLPIRLGGTHHPDNLIALSKEEHALAHLDLYCQYGDVRDFCAYYVITNNIEEVRLLNCSIGGKKADELNKSLGRKTGFQLFDEDKRKRIASKAGSVGGKVNYENQLGIFSPDANRLEYARLGGLAVIEINGFKDKKRQSDRGKKGGKKNKGFKWYNDGINTYKYTKLQQETEDFEKFIEKNNFIRGRKL